MNIAVTGASGFIGSNLVQFLKSKKHHVRAIVHSLSEKNKEKYSLADEILECDLQKQTQCQKAVQGVQFVYHLASNMGGVDYFYRHNYSPFIDNMRMDLNMLDACRRENVRRLFYAASVCAYPINGMMTEGRIAPVREEDIIPANSNQMYGWEKLMMILLSHECPIEVRVGIFDTIFGENQDWEGERAKFPPSIVAKVIKAKKFHTPIEIWGNGRQIRSFLYISDALEKIYEVMMSNKYHGEVNIASDERMSIQDCADWLCHIAKIKPVYIYNLKKPSGVISRAINTDKFKKLYTYRDRVSIREGFRKVYEYLINYV